MDDLLHGASRGRGQPEIAGLAPLAREDQKGERLHLFQPRRLEEDVPPELVPLPLGPVEYGEPRARERGQVAIDGPRADLAGLGKPPRVRTASRLEQADELQQP